MKKYLLLLLIPLLLAGCESTATTQTKSEAEQVADNQNKLTTAVPLPKLNNSLERENIKKRLELFDDQNKISYIYLVNFGRVMAYYTIKGKVTSSTKRLTSNEKFVDCDSGEYHADCATEAPSLDGSYGQSDPYVFFWTTEGVYVQWSGDYMLSDEPLKLSQQPELIRQIK